VKYEEDLHGFGIASYPDFERHFAADEGEPGLRLQEEVTKIL
jgi:hypothetical protein